MNEILQAQNKLFEDHQILITVFIINLTHKEVFRAYFRHIPSAYIHNPCTENEGGSICYPDFDTYPEAMKSMIDSANEFVKSL
jgi:hypothetical protein